MSHSSFLLARIRVAVALVVILTPMVVRTTPPVPPPYHQFRVQGTIVRTGGGQLQNYAVGVAERVADEWLLLQEGPRPLSITGVDGRFYVMAQSYEPVDSLGVALLLPGEDLVIAEAFRRDSVEPSAAREYYTPYRKSDGCCDDDVVAIEPIEERIVGYVYVYPEMTIMIP